MQTPSAALTSCFPVHDVRTSRNVLQEKSRQDGVLDDVGIDLVLTAAGFNRLLRAKGHYSLVPVIEYH